jgi:hypothetical protein
MNAKLTASTKTFFKFLFWTVLAAALQFTIEHLADLQLPVALIPIVGALLKAVATWIATQQEQ